MAEFIGLVCICIIIVLIIVIAVSYFECKKLVLTEYEVFTDRLPAAFDGYRIMVLADLHNMISGGRAEQIIEMINRSQPDIIILAGDMTVCTADSFESNMSTAAFLGKLADITDCYYGYGNHERGIKERLHGISDGTFDKYIKVLERPHRHILKLMDNESVKLVRGNAAIRLIGLNIDAEYYKRLVSKRLTAEKINEYIGMSGTEYTMLIAHNPDYFPAYSSWGADLVFSGHNHGGLIQIPGLGGIISPKFHIFPRYTRGSYRCEKSIMIVSGGMGAHSIKIRVNNVPELLMVSLRCDKSMPD